ITRVADLTGLDSYGIPVFASFRPQGKALSTSQGKGFLPDAALCGAYMEAIEVYYAEEVKPQLLQTTHAELSTNHLTLEPRLKNSLFYPDDYKYDWVMGKLLSGQPIYIPYPFVSMDTTNPSIALFGTDTTGLSSGNNLAEALLHGALEIIER